MPIILPMKRLTTAEMAVQIGKWVDSGRARQWRIEHDLSLSVSGDSCDVTPVAVLRWERGERRPRGRRNVVAYYKFLSKLAADAECSEAA